MSDSAEKSTAWEVTPDRYLAQHPPRFPGGYRMGSCYVPVRDGTRLAVDICLPAGSGEALPAIVIFTPYYRHFHVVGIDPSTVEASPITGQFRDAFVSQGYALVTVDVRGTGSSFGTRDGFRSPVERLDYYDVAEWILRQPWCNGKIGAVGISYCGAAACFLASTGHPAVKAVIPSFSVWDTYRNQFYMGGLLMNHFPPAYNALARCLDLDLRSEVKKYAYFANPHFAGPAPVDEDPDGRLRDQALREHLGNVDINDFIREFPFTDSTLSYDPGYTIATISPYHYAGNIRPDVAYYCVSGWMDSGYGDAAVNRYLSLPVEKKYLLLGPWEHGARTNVSPFRETPVPQFRLLAEYLRFFDHYLKGIDTGLERESPIHYFTMAEEAWKAADHWPEPGTGDQVFYFGPEAALSPAAPRKEAGADEYLADCGCGTGVNTRYERLSAKVVNEYYKDWPGRDARMLTYTTPALEENLEIAGHPIVTLYLSSTERDGGLFVYLEDVERDGTCRYVTEGVFRARHRKESTRPWNLQGVGPFHSFRNEDAQLLLPGEPAEISFSLLPISWVFRKGHRIRLALAAADQDHFSRIPGGRIPLLRFFRCRDRASRIVLPVIRK